MMDPRQPDLTIKNWKDKAVNWRSPQIWAHKGYKFWMYHCESGFLNWRCLKATRPDGSQFVPFYGYKTNLGSKVESVKDMLRREIEYDLLPPEKKQQLEQEERLLF